MLDESSCYMILSWQEGISARSIIGNFTSKKQYTLGVEAGEILKSIHQVDMKYLGSNTWYKIFVRKFEKKKLKYENCGLDIPKKHIPMDYVNHHLEILKNRPIKLEHGDFHLGNMIIDGNRIRIIDFDKASFADPYDDFKPFVWNALESEWFATGMIDGYFNHQIAPDFFPILKLYAAESLVSHIPWAQKFGSREIEVAFNVYRTVMTWYDDFKLDIPSWYKHYQNL